MFDGRHPKTIPPCKSRELCMTNKLLISALAAAMTIVTAAQADAATVKKKIVKPAHQGEDSTNKNIMDDVALGIASGLLGGAMKKAKLPKGGKLILKQGLKVVKESAKKSKDGGKKKDPLKALFGADDE